MRSFHCHIRSITAFIVAAFIFLQLLFPCPVAAQQVSSFSIAGWTAPGAAPTLIASDSNMVMLQYGDSLNTNIEFAGTTDDGLGTDESNINYMNFAYSYTIYLTPIDSVFSLSSSIPVGTHTVSASQFCSSGTVPPWTIGCDAQPTSTSDSVSMNIADGIGDCIAPGTYHVDILLDNYTIATSGPTVPSILLQWLGYTNSPARSISMVSVPESNSTNNVSLTPANNYLLGSIAYVTIVSPVICPSLSLSMPENISTITEISSATVSASYPGNCIQNPCSYLWSNGETTPTAINLTQGIYTVTVTAPCGTTATASVTISRHINSIVTDVPAAINESVHGLPIAADINKGQMRSDGSGPSQKTERNHLSGIPESSTVVTSLNTYPNPAIHTITFDYNTEVSGIYSIIILDMTGREVMRPADNISEDAGEHKINVYLDSLSPGVYIYEVISDKAYTGKFVKQ